MSENSQEYLLILISVSGLVTSNINHNIWLQVMVFRKIHGFQEVCVHEILKKMRKKKVIVTVLKGFLGNPNNVINCF